MKRFLLSFLSILIIGSPAFSVGENHLIGSQSPYLLQHLYNPVDWYPWGPEALEKAKRENKVIFVSVGYSSCHWCHVMEEESFENDDIAAFLNEHFVSIKIDREVQPGLDEQFMFVTQILTGTGGWPNSVFLTPEGDPFYAGGYFPPDDFMQIISKVHQAWSDAPSFIAREAAKVKTATGEYLTQKATALEVSPAVVAQTVASLLDHMDTFNGGLGVAPKFPREPLFLFLLDHADRTGEPDVLQAVTAMLDGMILGGIHDHVGGGFHRYAVDPDWHMPHFEKMLYTQALSGRLLIRAWDITGEPGYRRAAERLFDYVLRELTHPDGGFYSAQDADSLDANGESVEGAYYTWRPSDLTSLGSDAEFLRDIFQITETGDLDGASVLRLRQHPKELAPDFAVDPKDFTGKLDDLLLEMQTLRSARPAPFLDRKVLVSWNALMISTLAEASYILEDPTYYQAAVRAAEFILSRMNTPEGLKRVYFEVSPDIEGQLPDYASLGLALVALHDYAPDKIAADQWLNEALLLADEIRQRFGSPEHGLRMTENPEGLGVFIPIDDVEIPSGNSLALTLFARLNNRTQNAGIEQDSYRLANALSGNAVAGPEHRGYTIKAIQELQNGETGPLRFAAKGAVKASLNFGRPTGQITVTISMADGWHINSHKPLEDYLIATDLSVNGYPELNVEYPEATHKTLAFNSNPLTLYENELQIVADVPKTATRDAPLQATLSVQACSDEICLQPEEIQFSIWGM